MGPIEKTIMEQCYRNRQPLPVRISTAPELLRGLELYYIAFWDMSTCRAQGFGEGPISWLTLHEYSVAMEIVGEQREDLMYYVRRMDDAYLKHRAEKQARENKSKTK